MQICFDASHPERNRVGRLRLLGSLDAMFVLRVMPAARFMRRSRRRNVHANSRGQRTASRRKGYRQTSTNGGEILKRGVIESVITHIYTRREQVTGRHVRHRTLELSQLAPYSACQSCAAPPNVCLCVTPLYLPVFSHLETSLVAMATSSHCFQAKVQLMRIII